MISTPEASKSLNDSTKGPIRKAHPIIPAEEFIYQTFQIIIALC